MLNFLLKSKDVLYQVSSDLSEVNNIYSSFSGAGQKAPLPCLSEVRKSLTDIGLKIANIFKIQKIIFMLAFINNDISDEHRRLLQQNNTIDSYETRSSQILHVPKART